MKNINNDDIYFDEVKNLYLGDVGDYLKYLAGKLAENLKKLQDKNLDVEKLGSMVNEAPRNLELKSNVEK